MGDLKSSSDYVVMGHHLASEYAHRHTWHLKSKLDVFYTIDDALQTGRRIIRIDSVCMKISHVTLWMEYDTWPWLIQQYIKLTNVQHVYS